MFLKYVNKPEPRLEDMKYFITQTVQVSHSNVDVQQIIQKILIKMCAECDYSAQDILDSNGLAFVLIILTICFN